MFELSLLPFHFVRTLSTCQGGKCLCKFDVVKELDFSVPQAIFF